MKLFKLINMRSRFCPHQKERDIYKICSTNLEAYLQRVRTEFVSPIDEKGRYINKTETILWS